MAAEGDFLVAGVQKDYESVVIWMHGLGADGYDFVNIAQALPVTQEQKIKYIFPHAPLRPITMNQGYSMPAWFDLHRLEGLRREELDGIEESRLRIQGLIDKEVSAAIPSRRIILAGFSQGASMAVYTALFCPDKLAAVLAIAGCVPQFEQLLDVKHPHYMPLAAANKQTPIFWLHGDADAVVPVSMGLRTVNDLRKAGYQVTLEIEPGVGHGLGPMALNYINSWLSKSLHS